MNTLTATRRVLAVDDEPFQLKLLARQFTNLGLTDVQTCLQARAALDLVINDPTRFDLICCDLQMPDMDGVEFVRHLGQSKYRGGVVLISGEDRRILNTAERLAQSHALHVLGAFSKPVTPEQLSAVLAAAQADVRLAVRADAVAPVEPPKRNYSAAEVGQAITEHEFVNHYQPKVDFATGQVVGVETLVRWKHPRDGMVYPDQFVTVAEENDLIDRLTHVVLAGLHGALNQARLWNDQGIALQVSVNVSMDNLTDFAFPEYVAREVAAAGIAPSQLILEVTESRMMKDPLTALDILTRLRLKRIGVSIDDFGTGHSSLTQLRDAPFDELKIDKSFVHGACRNESLRAILLPSLDMARQLGIKTVAEGVEDADDWHFIRAQGCNLAQGYFVARPMPAEALPGWMAEWEARRDIV
jgi:EAL domain-containing protein (putative c-di-GMP-specific phosphodiesterase class I)/DNA-binding NarL/FixJ family response regulator